MLAQAPIFHGHVFSIYIELAKPVAEGDLAQALAGEHVEVARLAADSPSNVAAAGQENIMVAVRRDAQHANGFWIWAAADNFRIAALTAVDCAASLMAVRSKGPVQ
jgi:aspartate-semialdehyde dehydrogenase